MSGIIIIFEILFVMFLLSKQLMTILLWVMAIILFQMSFEYGNERIYLEIIEDYPIEDCITPKKCKFLFKKLNKLSYKDIPKEMYYCEIIKVYGFFVYSFAILFFGFMNEYMANFVGRIYIGFFCALSILSAGRMTRRSFLTRFKKINRHNIKYIFFPANKPYPKKIGKCKIMSESKRCDKRTFVTVKMLETGIVKEKVLLQSDIKSGNDRIYSIYEICGIYYAV